MANNIHSEPPRREESYHSFTSSSSGISPSSGPSMFAEDGGDEQRGKKRSALACIRCRRRHIKCPGGDPCKKCIQASQPCEYIEADKKIVISMKYLNKLHDDIARLKIENANLRNNLKSSTTYNNPSKDIVSTPFSINNNLHSLNSSQQVSALRDTPQQPQHQSGTEVDLDTELPNPDHFQNGSLAPLTPAYQEQSNEISIPFLDKYGKLINSRTGEKLYVGSSSMTLFGLEINNLLPQMKQPSNTSSPVDEKVSSVEATVLEREGNAYRIRLGQTKLSPGIAVNFTLPSYSYALLLVDTFISYNDGCFYFFNEGLVKENLRRIYKGEKLFLISEVHDSREVTIETIWFCQLLLIFAGGEMYLGTANNPNGNKLNPKSKKSKPQKPKLPGSEFFYHASELFTGLFSSGAITNCVLEGGIEVVLLYAFYLQVADCTIASYFYFGSALRACLMLGLHVDAGKENLYRYELEHRRRLFWTVFMFERMLASKAGLPLSLTDDYVSAELPDDFDMSEPPAGFEYYIFPEAEYIKNCVKITTINASILSSLYSKQPNSNILPVVNNLVLKLLDWKNSLPSFLQCDYSKPELVVSRLIVNMMTEFFQGMNLAVRPLLMHFTLLQIKQNHSSTYVDLSSYSKQLLTLLNSSFQASINTVRSLWALMPENMVALFGYMDREYLFTSAATLILFNSAFGVHEATYQHLDHALTIFTKMRNLGNHPAALRRAQLLKLLSILDFNGAMGPLIAAHDDDINVPIPNTDNMISRDEEPKSFGVKEESDEQSNADKRTSLHHLLNTNIGNNATSAVTPTSANPHNEIILEGSPQPTLHIKDAPLTPDVFNQYLAAANTDVEMELWNDISSQAMWLSGDVGEELNSLLGLNNK